MGQATTVVDNSAQIFAALHAAAVESVTLTSEGLKERVVLRIINPPKSGHIYTSGPPPLPHQASAPGESPANWTGKLVSDVYEIHVGLEAEVGLDSTNDYAVPLEFGTSKMAARPFVAPSVEEEKPLFVTRVAEAVKKVVG